MHARLLLSFVALLIAVPLAATSARTVNPVAGVKTITIEVMLGGPLTLDGDSSPDLFDSQLRGDRFKRVLTDAIAKRFVGKGITVDGAAKYTIMFSIWGRPLGAAACEGTSVALIEGSFHDDSMIGQPGHTDPSTVTWGRSIIVVTPDASIEESLEKAILELVDEVLSRGTGKDD